MKTLLIAASALALATPALAQMTGTTGAAPQSSTTPPAPDTGMPTSAPADGATQPAAPAAAPDAKTVIATEFPTYDKDGNGALSTGEFDTWMVALKDKSGAEPMKPADKTAWLKGAFKTADTDKNKAVSQAELTNYLTAGA